MNRNSFFSNNKTTEEVVYKTNISSATTSNVIFGGLPLSNLKKRIYYDPDYPGFNFFIQPNVTNVFNSYLDEPINFNYSGDPGNIKTITVKSNDFSTVGRLTGPNQKIYGDIDLTNLTGLYYLKLNNNPNLSGITCPQTNYIETFDISNCNVTGVLDVSMIPNMGYFFYVFNNPNLTKILHSCNTWIQSYFANNCNLTGNHDMTMFTNSNGIDSSFGVSFNPNLTAITHTNSSQPISSYFAFFCNLTGNHDMSMLTGLKGAIQLSANPNLTGITHSANSNIFNNYSVNGCNLTGTHDISMLTGLGGQLTFNNNANLTRLLHGPSSQPIVEYSVLNCNLTGNHDMSMLTSLGGVFDVVNNLNLTGITHSASPNIFNRYNVSNCNLTGTHDISMLTGLGGFLTLNNNTNLNNVLLPTVTGGTFIPKYSPTVFIINMSSCNLDYIDFWPLSSSTMSGTSISLSNNGMSSGDVNHILVDFDNISTLNQPKWSGITLDIKFNSPPDTSSGGYDGINAINNLTGSPKNWFITY